MKYTTLPNSEIKVSKICLGTYDLGTAKHRTRRSRTNGLCFRKRSELSLMWQNCIQFRQEQKRTEPQKKLLALGFKKHGSRDKVVLASVKLLAGELIRLILEKTDLAKEESKKR